MTYLRPVSDKQRKRLAEYSARRKAYLAEHPRCGFPNCPRTATEVHHKRGRAGKRLLDESHWIGLCLLHHSRVHHYPQEAKRLGLSESRL